MARTGSVWGIDVGQCALKALRCSAHDEPRKIVIEAFDYIEYPKILTQPDANPTELVADALRQFLSRNKVHGDRVAVSVSGQSGLARFIKLPPVETKKIPDIVRYEARQQIPFDLNDVIWDYQRMGGGSEEEGFVLETEIGLFAMKRDAVLRALEPFQKAGIEVDIVQLTPLALYNFVLFDQIQDLPPPDEYDPENPPESVVVVSLGTDATDLVVTNGYRVWQRSVPLGGSHFTKALTKDLKLTFAKAEHLKRNATAAQDPKAVFQAMRPVFNDLQTELQRSLGYFTNIDRAAKIGRVIALGSAFKLPGLRRYLSQSLGYDIERVDSFRTMTGPEVLANPAFKENLLSFGVCYGLALQALDVGGLRTNLLPPEIVRDRLMREKKPWAVAVAAALLLAASVSFTSFAMQLRTADEGDWKKAENAAVAVVGKSKGLKTQADEAISRFKKTEEIGKHLVSNVEGRTRWLALWHAIDGCLPTGEDPPPKEKESPAERIARRQQLHVTYVDCQQVDDVARWFAAVKVYLPQGAPGAGAPPGGPPPIVPGAPPPANPGGPMAPGVPPPPPTGDVGPTGPGIIVQLMGHHFHNSGQLRGAEFVQKTLLERLNSPEMVQLGVSYPILVKPEINVTVEIITPRPVIGAGPAGGAHVGGKAEEKVAPEDIMRLQQTNFRVQFVWKAAGLRLGGPPPGGPPPGGPGPATGPGVPPRGGPPPGRPGPMGR
ncbi:MAG: type IV pilus assembly protein PilM [Thermoguttaceae bacterium]|jgi:type IV pilus assembly protein PilM